MGILRQQATFILREHKFRPIEGDILMLGRQTVWMTFEDAREMLERENIPLRPDFVHEVDHVTIGARGAANYLTDRSFFSISSPCSLRVASLPWT